MLLPHRFCLSAAAALAALVPSALRAQDAFMSTLPEGTAIYFGASDIPAAVEGFQSSALFKIWEADETQEFFAELITMVEQQYSVAMSQAKALHEQGMLPVSPEDLAAVRLDSFHFAVTDLEMPSQDHPAPRVGVVAALDFGASSGTVQQLLSKMLPMAMMQMGENAPQPQVSEVAGSELTTLRLPELPFLSINWAWSGSKLLIGTDTARLSSIMKGLKEGSTGGFLQSKLYRTTDSKIGGRPAAFESYLNTSVLLDRGLQALEMAAKMVPNFEVDPAGVRRAMDVLGLFGLKGMGFRTGWENGKAFIDAFAMVPAAERKGLMSFFDSSKPIDRSHLAWIPREISSFSMGSMPKMSALYDCVMEAVKAYDPEAEGMAKMVLGQLQDELGLDIPALLGTLGGEMYGYQGPMMDMAVPQVVIAMDCPQPDLMLSQLKKLLALSEGMVDITESKEGGESVYGINVMMPGGGVDLSAMMDPAFTFAKGKMIFSFNRSDLSQALQLMNGDAEAGNITQHPEFAKHLKNLPQDAVRLSFTDVKAMVGGYYGIMSGALGMFDLPPNLPLDPGLLPTVETITDPLFADFMWSKADADGAVMRMVGPMGPEYFGLFVGATVGAITYAAIVEGEVFGPGRRR
ncbi:MAG: hypothetical protein CSA62_11160 [Planctomycetota bacterium]|nr:MAG: hypothetical protein CSA62_11160 [Planctomycetota bacterium]